MQEAPAEEFKARQGWFDNFKKQTGVHSVVRHSEAATSDKIVDNEFGKEFSSLIAKDGYVFQQCSTTIRLDTSGRKYSGGRTSPPRRRCQVTRRCQFTMKDRLTLIFCANPSGDLKNQAPPLLAYHS